MRIVISAPRKSGGAQLRCLLSMAYELKAPPTSAPGDRDPDNIAWWFAELPAASVSTCDLPHSLLKDPASESEVQLIGVIRHPFDLFVSNFDVAQQRAARGRENDEGDRAWDILSGEDLGNEVTQQYAAAEFAMEVTALHDWFSQGSVTRYEDLLLDGASVLKTVTPRLGPLPDEQIVHAVGLCPADNPVLSRPGRGRRMPALPPGAWRERLPESLLATLQTKYGAIVTELGYDAS